MSIDKATYVFENIEVVKTGRTATRKLPSGKSDILIEVTPADQNLASWKKWVNPNTLFTVVGDE